MPDRVLLVSPSRHLRGGAAMAVLDLATALADSGRFTPVVSVAGPGSLRDALTLAGVESVVIPAPHWASWTPERFRTGRATTDLTRRLRSVAGLTARLPAIRRSVRAAEPTIVMTCSAAVPGAALAARSLGLPHVWWLQEYLTRDHDLQYTLGEATSQRAIGLLSQRVVAASHAIAAHYSPPIPAGKTQVIHYALDGVTPQANRREGSLRLLLLCNLTASKGTELAVRGLAATTVTPRPQLRLVGSITDGYRHHIEALTRSLGVADNVTMAPYTTEPEHEILGCNVVLMCSRDEAFGRITAESLKAGRPVIGARSGGTVEIVADGDDGLLFEPGDAAALGAAIDRIATEPGLCEQMSMRAAERNRDRYGRQQMLEAFVTLFAEVAPPSNAGARA